VLGATFDSLAFPGQAEGFAAARRGWRHAPSGGGSVLPCPAALVPPSVARGETRVSVLMGGARWPGSVDAPEALREALALRAAREHLGVAAPPDLVLHSVARKSIPQYDVGHRARVAAARAAAAAVFGGRLVLVGNSLGGVGAADAIAGALAGANEALRKVCSAEP
jgi:oxygen-dependent protoporphyrinogen oxidase